MKSVYFKQRAKPIRIGYGLRKPTNLQIVQAALDKLTMDDKDEKESSNSSIKPKKRIRF